jgi:hypothetical protein
VAEEATAAREGVTERDEASEQKIVLPLPKQDRRYSEAVTKRSWH